MKIIYFSKVNFCFWGSRFFDPSVVIYIDEVFMNWTEHPPDTNWTEHSSLWYIDTFSSFLSYLCLASWGLGAGGDHQQELGALILSLFCKIWYNIITQTPTKGPYQSNFENIYGSALEYMMWIVMTFYIMRRFGWPMASLLFAPVEGWVGGPSGPAGGPFKQLL